MLAWQEIDLREDPDEPRYVGDPGDLIDLASTLEELAVRPAWHAAAACRGQGPEPWFPTRGESTDPAKAVCAGCPVRDDCLAEALAHPYTEDAGVWGGTSLRQRKALRRSTEVEAA